ncbi:MAG TPA: hypothetical protein VGR37_02805 [Longimicrobiaceae bacterium]|nr:hypothetical protein [Longimicrobiaceae bacterium]
MPDPTPRDQLLQELEQLAERATPGPWEAEMSIDFVRGEAHRTVVHYPGGGHRCVPVVSPEGGISAEDQAFVAAMDPALAQWMVRELRRLARVEKQHQRMASHLRHVDEFLRRRGLQAEAQRFAAVREQLSEIDWAS